MHHCASKQEHIKKQMAAKAEASTFRSDLSSSRKSQQQSRTKEAGGVVMHKLDLMNCKAYAPPHSVLFHCPTSRRIRGYFCIDKSRPSRGCLLTHGQNVACRVVLTWLWEQYKKAFPSQEVLFSFPDISAAPVETPNTKGASSSGSAPAPAAGSSVAPTAPAQGAPASGGADGGA